MKGGLFLLAVGLLGLQSGNGTGPSPYDRRYSFTYPYNYPYGYRYRYDYYPTTYRTQDLPTKTIPYDYGYYPYRYRYVHTDDYYPTYRYRYQQPDYGGKSTGTRYPTYPSNYEPNRYYNYLPRYPTYDDRYAPRRPVYTPDNYGYPYDSRYPSTAKQEVPGYRRSSSGVETRVIGPDTFPGRYLGPGKVNMLNGGRDAELVCQFSTTSNVVSNAVWSKIEGSPANTYSDRSPYYCPDCRTTFLDFDDYRYSSQETAGSSVVLIRDVRPTDHGVYRCVGSAQINPGGDTETVYRVIEFFGN